MEIGFTVKKQSFNTGGVSDLRGIDLRSATGPLSMAFDCRRPGDLDQSGSISG
jgi:hypothetical protein